MAKATPKSGRRKQRRTINTAIAHIKATFNNTMITITDTNGDVLCWASAGTAGFKGTRKSTPFAAQRAADAVAAAAKRTAFTKSKCGSRGPGSGRESAVTALQAAGLKILSIEDVTPLPHNGCRPPKRRRVSKVSALRQPRR